jgi:translation initiation factor 1
MRPEPKKRIATDSAQTPFAALGQAFEKLSVPELPAGPVVEAPTPASGEKRGRVILRRERAHRGGRTVIVIDDFPPELPVTAIEELGKNLRQACGSGGTVRGRAIEIQGEHLPRIREILEAAGFRCAGER